MSDYGWLEVYRDDLYAGLYIHYTSLHLLLRGAKTVISSTCKSKLLNEQVRCMIIEKSKSRDV